MSKDLAFKTLRDVDMFTFGAQGLIKALWLAEHEGSVMLKDLSLEDLDDIVAAVLQEVLQLPENEKVYKELVETLIKGGE